MLNIASQVRYLLSLLALEIFLRYLLGRDDLTTNSDFQTRLAINILYWRLIGETIFVCSIKWPVLKVYIQSVLVGSIWRVFFESAIKSLLFSIKAILNISIRSLSRVWKGISRL